MTPLVTADVALAIERLRGEMVERLGNLEGRLESLQAHLLVAPPAAAQARRESIREAGKSATVGAATAGALVGIGELLRRFLG